MKNDLTLMFVFASFVLTIKHLDGMGVCMQTQASRIIRFGLREFDFVEYQANTTKQQTAR